MLFIGKNNVQPSFLVINPQQINIDEHLKQILHVEMRDEVVLFSQSTTQPQKYGFFNSMEIKLLV